jgi:putative metallohydrolase (TIGR04338 family)
VFHHSCDRPHSVGRVRDSQRARVYAAEDAWALRLDAARRGAGRAQIAGSSVLLPTELLFGTLEAAQAYADRQLPSYPPVTLRTRKGQGKAHWEEPGVIALPVPEHGQAWALRESVLLHELAHHVAFHSQGVADHGPTYRACMLDLVGQALGPEAQLALRVAYGEHGV